MTRGPILLLLATAIASACNENSAPGNDREAGLTPPAPAAAVMPAEQALSGVATAVLHPQIMTDADLRTIPEIMEPCVFRMTEVGLPVLVYGSEAIIKLNDKLVPLPSTGSGRYGAGGVTVAVRSLDEEEVEAGERFASEFVLWLPGAEHELGYHGFSACEP